MAISRAPYVLVIHLKRFAYANMNAKLNKAVRFTTELNFPCTDQNLVDGKMVNDGNNMSMSMIKYQLYAVIVHCGSSTHSGHYYAYVKVHTSNLLDYCAILYYDILYYDILYYDILYYDILYRHPMVLGTR